MNNNKECPVGQKSYKSIQIFQIFIFFAIEICMICEDLKDFFASKASKLDNSPQATQKDDSLNSYMKNYKTSIILNSIEI